MRVRDDADVVVVVEARPARPDDAASTGTGVACPGLVVLAADAAVAEKNSSSSGPYRK